MNPDRKDVSDIEMIQTAVIGLLLLLLLLLAVTLVWN